jgi:hypothetical protein
MTQPKYIVTEEVVRELAEMLSDFSKYIPFTTIECNGNKCREPWCISCCGEEDAEIGLEQCHKDMESLRLLLKKASAVNPRDEGAPTI